MEAGERARHRTMLEGLAADLRRRLADTAGSVDPVAPDRAIGRLTRQDSLQAQQLSLALRRRLQQQLLRIEHALELMRQGRYGVCTRCGEAIGRERLEAAPDTFLCVGCIEALRPR